MDTDPESDPTIAAALSALRQGSGKQASVGPPRYNAREEDIGDLLEQFQFRTIRSPPSRPSFETPPSFSRQEHAVDASSPFSQSAEVSATVVGELPQLSLGLPAYGATIPVITSADAAIETVSQEHFLSSIGINTEEEFAKAVAPTIDVYDATVNDWLATFADARKVLLPPTLSKGSTSPRSRPATRTEYVLREKEFRVWYLTMRNTFASLLSSTRQTLNRQHRTLDHMKEDLQSELDSTQRAFQIRAVEVEKAVMNMTNQLSAENASLRTKIDQLQQDLQRSEAANAKLSSVCSLEDAQQRDAEIEYWKKLYDDLAEEYEELSKYADNLDADCDKLQKELDRRTKVFLSRQKQIAQREVDVMHAEVTLMKHKRLFVDYRSRIEEIFADVNRKRQMKDNDVSSLLQDRRWQRDVITALREVELANEEAQIADTTEEFTFSRLSAPDDLDGEDFTDEGEFPETEEDPPEEQEAPPNEELYLKGEGHEHQEEAPQTLVAADPVPSSVADSSPPSATVSSKSSQQPAGSTTGSKPSSAPATSSASVTTGSSSSSSASKSPTPAPAPASHTQTATPSSTSSSTSSSVPSSTSSSTSSSSSSSTPSSAAPKNASKNAPAANQDPVAEPVKDAADSGAVSTDPGVVPEESAPQPGAEDASATATAAPIVLPQKVEVMPAAAYEDEAFLEFLGVDAGQLAELAPAVAPAPSTPKAADSTGQQADDSSPVIAIEAKNDHTPERAAPPTFASEHRQSIMSSSSFRSSNVSSSPRSAAPLPGSSFAMTPAAARYRTIQRFKTTLEAGIVVQKHCRKASAHNVRLSLDSEEMKIGTSKEKIKIPALKWDTLDEGGNPVSRKKGRCLPLCHVRKLLLGQWTDVFKRKANPDAAEVDRSISLLWIVKVDEIYGDFATLSQKKNKVRSLDFIFTNKQHKENTVMLLQDIFDSLHTDMAMYVPKGVTMFDRVQPEYGGPLEVAILPEANALDEDEHNLCSRCHVYPSQYLRMKQRFVRTVQRGQRPSEVDFLGLGVLDQFRTLKVFQFLMNFHSKA